MYHHSSAAVQYSFACVLAFSYTDLSNRPLTASSQAAHRVHFHSIADLYSPPYSGVRVTYRHSSQASCTRAPTVALQHKRSVPVCFCCIASLWFSPAGFRWASSTALVFAHYTLVHYKLLRSCSTPPHKAPHHRAPCCAAFPLESARLASAGH